MSALRTLVHWLDGIVVKTWIIIKVMLMSALKTLVNLLDSRFLEYQNANIYIYI